MDDERTNPPSADAPGPDVFISYSTRDTARVFAIRDQLLAAGISVWIDEQLEAGEAFRSQLDRQLDRVRLVLVLWSHTAAKSRFVVDEADTAFEAGKYFPVLLDEGIRLPMGFRGIQAGHLEGFEAAHPSEKLDRVIERLRARLGLTGAELEDAQAAAWRLWVRRLHRARLGAVVAVVTALLALALHAAGVLDGLYGSSTRLRLVALQARAAMTDQHPDPRLRVVLLDREAEEALSGRPPPNEPGETAGVGAHGANWRGMHAGLLRSLADSEAKVVALDIAFGRKQKPAPRVAAGTHALAQAIEYARKRGTTVVIAATGLLEPGSQASAGPASLNVEPEIRAALERDLGGEAGRGFVTHPCVGINDGVALLMPVLLQDPDDPAATVRGLPLATFEGLYGASLIQDEDGSAVDDRELRLTAPAARPGGIDRRLRIGVAGRGRALGDLGEESCRVMQAGQVPVQLLLDRFPRALDARGAKPNAIPYEQALAGTFTGAAEGALRDKAVLVGASIGGDEHVLRTCSGLLACGERPLPGVTIHAATIESLLAGHTLRTLSTFGQLFWVLLFSGGAVWLRLLAADRGRPRWPGLVGLMVLDLLCTVGAAVWLNLLTDGLYHLAAIGGTHWAFGRLDRPR